MITQKKVKELFDYNEATGVLTRKVYVKGGKPVGTVVGESVNSKGYKQVRIEGKSYLVHRVVWLHVHGYLPEYLDHINQIKTDNRVENLRPASKLLNNLNTGIRCDNTTGYKGVSFKKQTQRFAAHIRINGAPKHLGYFDTAKEASEVYQLAHNERMRELA